MRLTLAKTSIPPPVSSPFVFFRFPIQLLFLEGTLVGAGNMDSGDDLIELLEHAGTPRVLVLGDCMLDRYVWGNAERISQEAPVILLRADSRDERLGGASSVATMLAALEAEVTLVSITGADANAEHVRKLLSDLKILSDSLIPDPSRPTTVKERYVGRAQARHPQQILRVDYETRDPVGPEISQQLKNRLTELIPTHHAVLISDYDKGVCTPEVLRWTIDLANQHHIPVIVDPIRSTDYSRYRGCTTMTPNRLEAGMALGMQINSVADALHAAERLRTELAMTYGMVTLDKDGIVVATATGAQHFPTRVRQVYDITGAGDMVLAIIGLVLGTRTDIPAATRLANVAGGLEVEKIGVATVTRHEIINDLLHSPSHVDSGALSRKLCSPQQLQQEIHRRKQLGHQIVFTNGCFDVLHAGHVDYLNEAKHQGDCLVVGLNSDRSVAELKGPGRPVNPQEARAAVLAGLSAVDYVVIFDEPTPIQLIEMVQPTVLVKGADYQKDQVVGGPYVESYGGRVHLAGLRAGYSTTNLISRMKSSDQ
ncbi:MAG: D-glycero-beta-D-manno-heptose 1-phosphate adenylyltransferase [Zavarzinella sp.]